MTKLPKKAVPQKGKKLDDKESFAKKESESKPKPKPKTAKIDSKKVIKDLRVKLTDAEIQASGAELADLDQLLKSVKQEKKDFNNSIKKRIDDAQEQFDVLSQRIRERSEIRPIECKVSFDTPKIGMKRTTRLDTFEVVGKDERMTAEEMQLELIGKSES